MTTLESLRVLLTDPKIAAGEGANTLEFHWYAGEEGGLLGSGDIFDDYQSRGEVVKAMLQQDMTGYGDKPLGVITDSVDQDLTAFVRKVIDEVSRTRPSPPSSGPEELNSDANAMLTSAAIVYRDRMGRHGLRLRLLRPRVRVRRRLPFLVRHRGRHVGDQPTHPHGR